MMVYLRNEKGIAIPLVLVTLVVLVLLGTALWQYSASELRNVAFEEDRTQAFYVARSGAETVARYIMLNPSIAEDLLDGTTSTVSDLVDFGHESLGDDKIGDMQVSITDIGDDKLEITGLGIVNGSEGAVSIVLELRDFPDPEAVVVTTGTGHVNFHQNMTVEGSIVAGGPVTLPDSYDEDEFSCTPNFQFPPDYFKRVVVPDNPDPDNYYWPNLTIGTHTIYGNQHHEIDNLTVNNNGKLIFDFNSSGANSTAILVVSDLDLKNGSEIKIEGIGTVEIYIRNTATMNGPQITYPEGAQLIFFLAEGCEVSLNGNVGFDGLFYGPYDTHVKLQSNTSVNGAMIVGTLSGQGGSNQIGASNTAFTYYSGFSDLEFMPIVNQLHWKP